VELKTTDKTEDEAGRCRLTPGCPRADRGLFQRLKL